MDAFQNKFHVGQVVHHRMFGYRGVIYAVDPTFRLTEEWYDRVARSRPPKDRPWYHVLVDGRIHTTYVAERHLELSEDASPVDHPMIRQYFDTFHEGFYSNTREEN